MIVTNFTEEKAPCPFGSLDWVCARLVLIVGIVIIQLLTPVAAFCKNQTGVEAQWGGHLRTIGTASWPDEQGIYQFSDNSAPFYDGQAELRLNNQLFFGSRWSLETHYEAVLLRGDTLEANNQVAVSLPLGSADGFIADIDANDDRRLMNLTHTIDDDDGHILFHRLDRLNLTWAADWGTLRLGRQALTWGNGLVFNPMDLFNPFEPTTVQRDYKRGEDMAHLQRPLGNGEIQALYVPRRNPDNSEIEEKQASYAAKWHMDRTPFEFDLMVARHYEDAVFGAGITGFLGGAAWRMDALYTLLDETERRDNFWQAVANIDYAWQWGGHNFYGLLEYYHNDLGRDDNYPRALGDPDLSDRLQRGELFTLGRDYLTGRLQMEVHPLVQAGGAVILNMADKSGIFQPQLTWDVRTNWQMIVGANLYWGDNDTEYGGYEANMGFVPITISPANSAYLWITRYF